MSKRKDHQHDQEHQEQVTTEVSAEGTEVETTEAEFTSEVEFDGSAPSAEDAAAEAQDTRKWHIGDKEVSKSEFIRDQFTNHNQSRKQISEKFNISYRTVYGATVNMVNEAEPATRGRSAGQSRIQVTAAGDIVTVIENVTHVNNVAVSDEDAAQLGELTEVDRNTWIREQVAAGKSRGDIATALGLSYGVVYSLTKDDNVPTQRHQIEYQGKIMTRSEYIRARAAEGISKSDIAKELGVDYPVVWSALKSQKSEAEKFAETIAKLATFADKVEHDEKFAHILKELSHIELKAEEVQEEVQAEAVTEATESESVYVAE